MPPRSSKQFLIFQEDLFCNIGQFLSFRGNFCCFRLSFFYMWLVTETFNDKILYLIGRGIIPRPNCMTDWSRHYSATKLYTWLVVALFCNRIVQLFRCIIILQLWIGAGQIIVTLFLKLNIYLISHSIIPWPNCTYDC